MAEDVYAKFYPTSFVRERTMPSAAYSGYLPHGFTWSDEPSANGHLRDVYDWRHLVSDGDWTSAVLAAMDSARHGITFGGGASSTPQEYVFSNASVTHSMEIVGTPGARLRPFSFLSTTKMFSLEADHIHVQGLNILSHRPMESNGGSGAELAITLDNVGTLLNPVYQLRSNADSLIDASLVTPWAPFTAYFADTAPGAANADRREYNGSIYVCLQDHTSSSSFDADIFADYWQGSTDGGTLYEGGSGYGTTGTDGTGAYFDYAVIDQGGSGGTIRCYVENGVITRFKTLTPGTGYDFDSTDARATMIIGRGWPQTAIDTAVGLTDIVIERCRIEGGRHGLSFNRTIDGKALFNDILNQGSSSAGLNAICTKYFLAQGNVVSGGFGGLRNAAAFRYTGASDDYSFEGRIIGNIFEGVGLGVGFGTNLGATDGLTVSGNQMRYCTGAANMEIKQGQNAVGIGTGGGNVEPEFKGVHRVVVSDDNIVTVRDGEIGVAWHSNVNADYDIDVGCQIRSIGRRDDAEGATGLLLINPGGHWHPNIEGIMYQGVRLNRSALDTDLSGIRVSGALRGIYASSTDQVSRLSLRGAAIEATAEAYNLDGVTDLKTEGGSFTVRGRRIASVTVTSPGTGGPVSSEIPFYLDGGGEGMGLGATVVSGVITAGMFVASAQEYIAGRGYFDWGSGTFTIKVAQNSGSGAILRVTVVDGIPTLFSPGSHVEVLSGGAGYLKGGSATADQPMIIDVPERAKGYVTTDGTGAVTTAVVESGGWNFNEIPTVSWEAGISWTTPPVLTPVLDAAYGARLDNTRGGEISGGRYSAYTAGIFEEAGCIDLKIDSVLAQSSAVSVNGAPILTQSGAVPGKRTRNLELWPGAPNPQTIVSEALYALRQDVYMNTSGGAADLRTVSNCVHGEIYRFRIADTANPVTLKTGGTFDFNGLPSLTFERLSDLAQFFYDQGRDRLILITSNILSYGGGATSSTHVQQALSELQSISGYVLIHDYGDANCTDLAGQLLADLSGNGNEFCRGLTSAVEATDPTSAGTADAFTSAEYLQYDGGDICAPTGAVTFDDDWHKPGGVWSGFVIFYYATGGAIQYLFGNSESANIEGVNVRLSAGGQLQILQRYGTGVKTFTSSVGSATIGAWNFVAWSIDSGAGTAGSWHCLNGVYRTIDGTYTTPSVAAASAPAIGGRGGTSTTTALLNGNRIGAIGLASRAASQTEMRAFYTAVQPRWTLP